MPVSLEEFCGQISELGLLSDSELSSAQATVNSLPANEVTRAFAKILVRQNKVTAFQAQQLIEQVCRRRLAGIGMGGLPPE